ncbi:MAG: hypothetical protein AAF587_19960 [Bacteroidota bacterium]
MNFPNLLIKVFNWIPLLTLSCLLTAFAVDAPPPNEGLEGIAVDSSRLRIAILPFQDESRSVEQDKPNSIQFFNHIMGSVKQVHACQKNLDWISKSQLSKSFQTFGQEIDPASGSPSYSYDILDSICTNLDTDILVQGEFLVDETGEVEVFYSYENCHGFYSSQIKYQSSQPITGTIEKIDELYSSVGKAIKSDIEAFLDCQEDVDVQALLSSGLETYKQADSLPAAYYRAIDYFEQILSHTPSHEEALYYAGLAHFSLGEHKKASGYFAQIPEYKDTPQYQVYCRIGSRPAFWYDTDRKRKIWWDKELSPEWQATLNIAVLKKEKSHTPSIEELAELFDKTSVQIVNLPLDNLEGLSALTNITQLSCNKNRLSSLQGVEKLQNLGQINLDNNKLNSLKGIDKLPLLTRLYVRNNPIKSLSGIEQVDKNRFVLFCSYNVPKEEIRRVKNLGINIQQ